MGKARSSYTVREKLAAISYAEEHGNRAAGRQYALNEVNVRKWRKQKPELMSMAKTRRANRGRGACFPAIETAMQKYVKERQDSGVAVSTTDVHLEALKLAEKQNIQSSFKASKSWVNSFMKRQQLSMPRRTHISQMVPEAKEPKICNEVEGEESDTRMPE